MSDNRIYFCTVCERTWEQLPDDAVQLTNGFAGKPITYRFSGEVHVIKRKKVEEQS